MKDQKAVQATVVSMASQDRNQTPMLLALFDESGQPLDISGGSQISFFGGASAPDPGIENGGAITILEFDPPMPPAPSGSYLAKLHVEWGVGSPSTGQASAQLVHVDADENQITICRVDLSMDDTGDGPLMPSGMFDKMDFGIVPNDGHFEVWVSQDTDQHPMPVFVAVTFVKV